MAFRRTPSAASQTESAVIAMTVPELWGVVRRINKVLLGRVTEAKWVYPASRIAETADEVGLSPRIGSMMDVRYDDGSEWRIRVTAVVEERLIAYEVISAHPEIECDAIAMRFELTPVTETGHALLSIRTEYTNQVDVARIEDAKYKKREFFRDLRRTGVE